MADVQANPLAGGAASPSTADNTLRKRFSDDGDTPADQSPEPLREQAAGVPQRVDVGMAHEKRFGRGRLAEVGR